MRTDNNKISEHVVVAKSENEAGKQKNGIKLEAREFEDRFANERLRDSRNYTFR